MKSKKTTYILVAVVLAVWGVIIGKLFSGTEQSAVPELPPPAAVKDIAPTQKDTLWLNYPDPFLERSLRSIVAENPVTAVAPLPEKPGAGNTRNMSYYGRIAKKGKAEYMIGINGQQCMLSAGEAHDGYKLVKVYADSVVLSKDNVTYCLIINQ